MYGRPGLTTNLCVAANRPVEVRILLSQPTGVRILESGHRFFFYADRALHPTILRLVPTLIKRKRLIPALKGRVVNNLPLYPASFSC